MLYKKYHRNYVRQFRKGTVFVYYNYYDYTKGGYYEKMMCEVEVEPFMDPFFPSNIKIDTKVIKGSYIQAQIGVVDYKGQLIEKDAIQEISQKLYQEV